MSKVVKLINRHGSKIKMLNYLLPLLPKHTCYCEVFFGSGALYFAKPPSYVEIINDADKELINLHKMVKHHADEVVRLLNEEFASCRDTYEFYKNQSLIGLTEIQRAVRYYYINRNSFGSLGSAYLCSPTEFRGVNKKTLRDNLQIVKNRLANTYIESSNFDKIITNHDRSTTLFFLDPPYVSQKGYDIGFGMKDIELLSELIKNIKGKVILTLGEDKEVLSKFDFLKIHDIDIMYNINVLTKGDIKKEYILTNFDTTKTGLFE